MLDQLSHRFAVHQMQRVWPVRITSTAWLAKGVSASHAQRLMGRCCKTLLPVASTLLQPRYSIDEESRAIMGKTVRMKLPGQKAWSIVRPGASRSRSSSRNARPSQIATNPQDSCPLKWLCSSLTCEHLHSADSECCANRNKLFDFFVCLLLAPQVFSCLLLSVFYTCIVLLSFFYRRKDVTM